MPTGHYKRPSTEERFWSHVDITEDCWLWTASTNFGYGQFYAHKRNYRPHRYAYELLVGEVPDGLVLDHLCRVRHCVNPAHLEPVTHRTNINRGVRNINKINNLPLGVYQTRRSPNYAVCKTWFGERYYLGVYKTAEEASVVYQTAVHPSDLKSNKE